MSVLLFLVYHLVRTPKSRVFRTATVSRSLSSGIGQEYNRIRRQERVRRLLATLKTSGETIGLFLWVPGAVLVIAAFCLVAFRRATSEWGLLGLALGLLSVGLGFVALGLGFVALGTSAKSDKRHDEQLASVSHDLTSLRLLMGDRVSVTVSAPEMEAILEKGVVGEEAKKAAQKRLDEDTQRVGYPRGEVYEVEPGKWAIHWGGKYPL